MSAATPAELHRLLQRQLRRLGLSAAVPPDADAWIGFLERVSSTYTEVDDERYLMERSESLASGELASLNEALKSARDQAEASAQVKSTFLANMSHEIRTPLNAVLGMAYLALQTNPSASQKEYLGKIQQAGQHLLGIINDILDFSKIEAGRLSVEQVPFELREALDGALAMVSERAHAKNLATALEVDPRVPERLVGDPQRLRQILINYLNNAVKFTDNGGVTLRVSLAPVPRQHRGELLFEVIDTGVGVAPSEVDRIFRSFEQADASTTRRYGGTGLGLAICRRLAELMGGTVGVTSEPGVGSVFWFRCALMPIDASSVPARARTAPASVPAPGPAPATHPEAAPGAEARPAVRILLVEDNELNQQVAAGLLRILGLDIDIASDGQQALDRLAQTDRDRYALVLMDVHMPVMDGMAATRAIRAMPRWKDIPVIALTASVLPEERQRCLDAGMNALLPKPVEPMELEACLRRWIPALSAPISPTADVGEAAEGAPALSRLARIAGLDTDTGLHRCGGDAALYLKMLGDFLTRWSGIDARARECVVQRDWSSLHRDAHSFKSVCATLGAYTLQAQALGLERAAAEMRDAVSTPEAGQAPADALLARISDAILSLKVELAMVEAGVRAALPSGPAPTAGSAQAGIGGDAATALPADRHARAVRAAREVMMLLQSSELIAVQQIESERDLYRAWMGTDRFSALERALRDYDLEAAAEVLGASIAALDPDRG